MNDDTVALVIELCAMQDLLPPLTAANCALVNRQIYNSVEWYLDKLFDRYHKYCKKFGRVLYSRLIKHPFRADKTIATIRTLNTSNKLSYEDNGIIKDIFRTKLYKKPFTDEFTEKNIIAIANVKLRIVAPIDIKFDFIYIAHKLQTGVASADRFVPVDCGGRTYYMLDLKLYTRYNFIPSLYVDMGRFYLDIFGTDVLTPTNDNKIIVEYYIMAPDKYKYDEYYACYNGKLDFIKKTSFIRHQDDVQLSDPEPEPDPIYDNLDNISIYASLNGYL